MGASLKDRLENRTVKTDTCWIWTGVLTGRGYGQLTIKDNKKLAVHRLAYELHHGPIPPEMTVDHTCAMTFCVNPDHLQLLSRAENSRLKRTKKSFDDLVPPAKKVNWAHGVCARGHDISNEAQIYTNNQGSRGCKKCRVNTGNIHQNARRQHAKEVRQLMLVEWKQKGQAA